MSDMAERVHRLGEHTARMLAGLWQQHQDGELTRDELIDLAVVILRVSHAQARLAAEAAFTAWKLQQGLPADPEVAPIPPHYAEPDDRLTGAVGAILDTSGTPDESLTRLERLGRGEATAAAHDGLMGALRESDAVVGWTRGLESKACQLCIDLAAGGKVFDSQVDMHRHIACACTAIPVAQRN